MKPQNLLLATAGLLFTLPAAAFADGETGTVFLDMRARYENADQDGKLGADATTLRTRLGWRSPDWNGLWMAMMTTIPVSMACPSTRRSPMVRSRS